MREIKFRAKKLGSNEWTYGGIANLRNVAIFIEIKSETLGQYIGRKDKNGKEIYEGDVLKGCWGEILWVYYDKDYLQFRAKTKTGNNAIDYYGELNKLEVIGNIYDNPELLEELKNE